MTWHDMTIFELPTNWCINDIVFMARLCFPFGLCSEPFRRTVITCYFWCVCVCETVHRLSCSILGKPTVYLRSVQVLIFSLQSCIWLMLLSTVLLIVACTVCLCSVDIWVWTLTYKSTMFIGHMLSVHAVLFYTSSYVSVCNSLMFAKHVIVVLLDF